MSEDYSDSYNLLLMNPKSFPTNFEMKNSFENVSQNAFEIDCFRSLMSRLSTFVVWSVIVLAFLPSSLIFNFEINFLKNAEKIDWSSTSKTSFGMNSFRWILYFSTYMHPFWSYLLIASIWFGLSSPKTQIWNLLSSSFNSDRTKTEGNLD